MWTALEHGEIDPATTIRELQAGLPAGAAAVLPFTHHPLAAVRLEAIGAAAACGHAGVIETYREPGRIRDGRRFGRPPDPHQPPEVPEGKVNVTDPDSRPIPVVLGVRAGI